MLYVSSFLNTAWPSTMQSLFSELNTLIMLHLFISYAYSWAQN